MSKEAETHVEKDRILSRLRHIVSEEYRETVLLQSVEEQLADLRLLYKKNRNAFDPTEIGYLKSVRAMVEAVGEFGKLLPELPAVSDMNDYVEARTKLRELHAAAGEFAVAKRIHREIRQLDENRERFMRATNQKQQDALNARYSAVERQGPICECGSKMVLRKGPGGLFWGCISYPECLHTKQLRPQDRALLQDIDT